MTWTGTTGPNERNGHRFIIERFGDRSNQTLAAYLMGPLGGEVCSFKPVPLHQVVERLRIDAGCLGRLRHVAGAAFELLLKIPRSQAPNAAARTSFQALSGQPPAHS